MSTKIPTEAEIKAVMFSLPGKRGVDIPEDIFDKIAPIAHSTSNQIWGSNATPHQLQALHDGGHHEPQQVKDAFGALPHPLAPDVTVSEYEKNSEGLQKYNEAQR